MAFSLMSEVYAELARELDFKADKADNLSELIEASRTLDRFISVKLPDLQSALLENKECRNCGAPISKCGPELWEKQKKCCPECTHTEE